MKVKRHALFVGVDDYADGHIPNLNCAVSDATDLHGFFKFGAGYDRVELLPNPAGKREVLSRVRELTAGLGKGDFFLFFFAGHGFRVGEDHVLVCADDLYEDVKYEDDGLPLGQLKRRLSGAFDSALFLDACQSDILATRGGEGIAERDISLILDTPVSGGAGGAMTIVTSCDAGQTAAELAAKGHGLFTFAMLDLLRDAQRRHARLDISDSFRMNLGTRMRDIAVRDGLTTEQRPRFSSTGLCNLVLLDGVVADAFASAPPPPPPSAPVAAPVLVVCPICGKKNDPRETFKCRECGRDNLCLRHQDEATFLCRNCAEKVMEAEAQRKAEEDAKAIEEARIAKEKAEEEERKRKAEEENEAMARRQATEKKAQENAQRQDAEQTAPTPKPIVPKPNGQYRETVDGLTWNFKIARGQASIGSGKWENVFSATTTTPKGAVIIPSTLGGCPVTSIGERAFYECSHITSVIIPDSVTCIGDGAFDGCSGLTAVKFGNGVTTVGMGAFQNCNSLTSVTIPCSVTSIKWYAFGNCKNLVWISVAKGNKDFKDIDGVLFSKGREEEELVAFPAGRNGTFAIPGFVTSIGWWAFADCRGLTSVIIPHSVTCIGTLAFQNCSGLTSVTLPDSVTCIGEEAFGGCSGLTAVTIPDSVTDIGRWAFKNCISLTSVTIPRSVTSIGEGAFSGCINLSFMTKMRLSRWPYCMKNEQ